MGRLEGNVEQLALAIKREHEERTAAFAEHRMWNVETDKRIELVLDRLATQIGTLTGVVEINKNETARAHLAIDGMKERKTDNISAWRWFVGIAIALISASNILVNHNTNMVKQNIDRALQEREELKNNIHREAQLPSAPRLNQ